MSATSSRWSALGFTLADYEATLAAQDGHCAVCPSRPRSRRLHVDHDHKTGAVRGLLCFRHNKVVGTYNAKPDELRALADYLERAR